MGDSFAKFLSLEDELAQRARQQAVVARFGQRALLGVDLQTLMDETVVQVAQTLGNEYCEALELLPGGDALLLKAGIGWKPGLVGKATVSSDLNSQAGYTLYANGPVIVEDLRTETRFQESGLLVDHNVVSGISVIIPGHDRPYGVLGTHTTTRRNFTQDDVNFLQSVANVLAAAIERKQVEGLLIERSQALEALNSSLEWRVTERAGTLRLLQQVAAAANQADSMETAFQFVLDLVCAFTGWPVGHVYQPTPPGDPQGPRLIPTDLWHPKTPGPFSDFHQRTMDTPLEVGAGLPGRVYATGKPAWYTDVTRELHFPRTPAAVESGIKAGFAFPVLVGDEVAAVLEFYSIQETEPDQRLLELMANIGTQLGRVVERQRAQTQLLSSNEELRHSQEQLAEAQKIAHLGSWDWDIEADKVHWSDEMQRIFGIEPGPFQINYQGYLDWIYPDDRERVAQVIQQAYHTGQSYTMEHRIRRSDGQERLLYAEGRIIKDADGRPVRMLGIAQDITERRKIEEALQQSLVMFEKLFESAPDGTLLIDEQGKILRVNRRAEVMFGYGRSELIGQPLKTLLPDQYQESKLLQRRVYGQDGRRSMATGPDLFASRKDGSEFPVDILLSPLDMDGGPQMIAVVRDITERRQAEEALRQSEARFRSIFEGAALGIAVVDLKRRILMSNPRMEKLLGYTAEELRGTDKVDYTYPLDQPATLELYRTLLNGEQDTAQMEKRYVRKDGQVMWGSLTVSLVRDAQGNPLFAVSMIEEITHRKQMEAELAEVQYRLMAGREQERMQLAQELHDVPLQDLYVILYQLNEFDEAIGDPVQYNQLKEAQAEGIRQVITTLRTICGELRSPTLSPFGLEGAIREHADQFQTKHPQMNIHLDLMPDDQMLSEEVRLNLFRIYQQGLNNVVRHSQASNVTVRFYYDEQKVVLEIEDDGQGFVVPQRWIGLARQGHLGLVGAAERAEMIGGTFRVISTPGKGTQVRVEVPRVVEQKIISGGNYA